MRAETPTVLFADTGLPWEAFTILASALRRRHIGTVRLTAPSASRSQRLGRLALRAAYEHTNNNLGFDAATKRVTIPDLQDDPTLVRTRIVDVQAIDRVGHELTRSSFVSSSPASARTRVGIGPDHLYDKLIQSRDAAAAGVDIPRTSESADDVPGDRLVVKQCVGSGGDAVLIARRDEAVSMGRLWADTAQAVMYQQLVRGEELGVGGFAVDGRIVAGSAFRLHKPQSNPNGPAVRVTPLDEPALLEASQSYLSELGYTGAFSMDFIVSDKAHLIDMNPRFFGAWPALQQAGVPILEAYTDHIFGRTADPAKPASPGTSASSGTQAPPAAPTKPGVTFDVPRWSTLAADGSRTRTVRTCLQTLADMKRIAGPRSTVALTPTLARVLRDTSG